MKMKYTYVAVLLAFCLISSFANAQLRPGSKLLTGSFSMYTVKIKSDLPRDVNNLNFAFAPKFGFVTKETSVWGVMADIGLGWQNGETSNKSFAGGLFFRQYKKFGDSRFSGFLEETVNGGVIHMRDYSPDPVYSTDGWRAYLSLNPGLAFQVSKKSFLELTVSGIINAEYLSLKEKTNYIASNYIINTDRNSFSFSSNLQTPFNAMNLGYSFNF